MGHYGGGSHLHTLQCSGSAYGSVCLCRAFIKHLAISRIETSAAYMIGTLLSALVMNRAEMFYDYFGARVAAKAGTAGPELCLIFLSCSMSLSLSLSDLTGIKTGSAAFGIMIIGFFGIKFFGKWMLTHKIAMRKTTHSAGILV